MPTIAEATTHMAKKRTIKGLTFDPETGKGRIFKTIPGVGEIRRRFTASSWREAESIFNELIQEAKNSLNKPPPAISFTAAATKYLTEEAGKKSIERDAGCLENLVGWIGTLPIDQVHQNTLQPYIENRRSQGIKSGTVARELAVVRRILTLCARLWRDDNGRPYLPSAPLIKMPDWGDKAKPYPLNWDEQKRLFEQLPAHLAEMALFAVNTGAREAIICGLRWEWETKIKEANTTVFIVPGRETKNGTDCLIVLNDIARSVIDSRRGRNDDYVFTYDGHRIDRMNSGAWRRAWKEAGLPTGKDTLSGPHNLRHTFARRLRVVGVPLETRKALMHHINGDITIHYSPAEMRELIDAVNRLSESRTVTVLRAVR